ncbi:hypothetical protein JL720_5277 [Aureococcus anophagefferens]|nr:hypothetical protein JL720_5277 [Aureococcus anophagefferens]
MDHHDSSSRSAVAESLRLHAAQRVVATLDPDLPFFEACAPSQTCARNLHEPARDRLWRTRDGAADPLPESWPRAAYDRAAALDAVRSGACAPSAAVPRGLARPGTRDDAPRRVRLDGRGPPPPAAPALAPPAAGPFAERLRDTVGAALGAGASARVYWTVADASRAAAVAEFFQAYARLVAPNEAPGVAAAAVAVTVGVDAASAPGRVVVAWRPEGAAAAELCERRRWRGVPPRLAKLQTEAVQAERRGSGDARVKFAARSAGAGACRHAAAWATVAAFLSAPRRTRARDADARRRRGCGDGDLAAAAARAALGASPRATPSASDAETVVSHEHPAILSGSTVVHVRGGDDDLDAADDVKAGGRGGGSATTPYASIARVAKELQLWEGADDGFGDAYYAVGRHRRYVAVEDSLRDAAAGAGNGRPTSKARPVSARFGRWLPPDFHAGEKLALVAFNLALAAYFTGRVAVLPAGLHFEKFYYLWEFVDVRGAASMGRVTVLGDGRVAAAAVEDVGRDYDARAALGARYYAATDLGRRLPYLVANEDPRVRDADVFYLDMDATMTNALVFPERLCFVKGPQSRSGHGCLRDGKVEDWLGLFYDLRVAGQVHRGGEAAIARKMQDRVRGAARGAGGLRAEPNEFG